MERKMGLCRAKRLDNGEMVEGYLIYDEHDKLYRIVMGLEHSTGTHVVSSCAPRVDSKTIDFEWHEKWINDDGYDEWHCSGCGHKINCDDYPTEYEDYQYCGKCGARMDGEANGTT